MIPDRYDQQMGSITAVQQLLKAFVYGWDSSCTWLLGPSPNPGLFQPHPCLASPPGNPLCWFWPSVLIPDLSLWLWPLALATGSWLPTPVPITRPDCPCPSHVSGRMLPKRQIYLGTKGSPLRTALAKSLCPYLIHLSLLIQAGSLVQKCIPRLFTDTLHSSIISIPV